VGAWRVGGGLRGLQRAAGAGPWAGPACIAGAEASHGGTAGEAESHTVAVAEPGMLGHSGLGGTPEVGQSYRGMLGIAALVLERVLVICCQC
jgi:hypothetical protein